MYIHIYIYIYIYIYTRVRTERCQDYIKYLAMKICIPMYLDTGKKWVDKIFMSHVGLV